MELASDASLLASATRKSLVSREEIDACLAWRTWDYCYKMAREVSGSCARCRGAGHFMTSMEKRRFD